MKTYRLRLQPIAPWSTPWHADTLFAALCWQVRHVNGITPLQEMLLKFRQEQPPFVLSDAFPEGLLPCPLSAEIGPCGDSNISNKRPTWIPETEFRALIREAKPLFPRNNPTPVVSFRRLHAAIDRNLGSTAEAGSLFEMEEFWLSGTADPIPKLLNVYVRAQDSVEALVSLFQSLSDTGFGKKRSSGKGAFRLVGTPEPCDWMDDNKGANAFVSLSHFIPASQDSSDGRWRLLVKYPKFSPGVPANNPFKGRLLMLQPGSVFRVSEPVRSAYGQIMEGISPDFPDAVHCALAFAVPMVWPENEQSRD